VKAEEKAMLK